MKSVCEVGVRDCGGEILQPMSKNKWRIVSWNHRADPVDVADHAISLQAISLNVLESPSIVPTLFTDMTGDGKFVITIEEDEGGRVYKAIEVLKQLKNSELRVEVLGGSNNTLKTITFGGVVIVSHLFDFDYASSETLKAELTCSFTTLKIE